MRHLKRFEDKKIEKVEICFAFIKPENLKIILSEFDKNELSYRLFEAFDHSDNFNIIAIVQANKSQRMSLLKYVTLTVALKTAEHVVTTCTDITDMTADEILERYDMYNKSNKYNI